MMPQSLFITLEGGEGCGKSTQINLLKSYFKAHGLKAIFTREPGGTPYAEKLRNVVLSENGKEISPLCEYLTFSAARINHLETVIYPALKDGYHMFCDRFIDSSLIYQGYVHDLPIDNLMQQYLTWSNNFLPHITLLLDADPSLTQQRVISRRAESNRFDEASLAFHQKVRQGFLMLVKLFPERIVSINADADPQTIQTEIIKTLKIKNVI